MTDEANCRRLQLIIVVRHRFFRSNWDFMGPPIAEDYTYIPGEDDELEKMTQSNIYDDDDDYIYIPNEPSTSLNSK